MFDFMGLDLIVFYLFIYLFIFDVRGICCLNPTFHVLELQSHQTKIMLKYSKFATIAAETRLWRLVSFSQNLIWYNWFILSVLGQWICTDIYFFLWCCWVVIRILEYACNMFEEMSKLKAVKLNFVFTCNIKLKVRKWFIFNFFEKLCIILIVFFFFFSLQVLTLNFNLI